MSVHYMYTCMHFVSFVDDCCYLWGILPALSQFPWLTIRRLANFMYFGNVWSSKIAKGSVGKWESTQDWNPGWCLVIKKKPLLRSILMTAVLSLLELLFSCCAPPLPAAPAVVAISSCCPAVARPRVPDLTLKAAVPPPEVPAALVNADKLSLAAASSSCSAVASGCRCCCWAWSCWTPQWKGEVLCLIVRQILETHKNSLPKIYLNSNM